MLPLRRKYALTVPVTSAGRFPGELLDHVVCSEMRNEALFCHIMSAVYPVIFFNQQVFRKKGACCHVDVVFSVSCDSADITWVDNRGNFFIN